MITESDEGKLIGIAEELNDIDSDISSSKGVWNQIDNMRSNYFLSELNTLTNILKMLKFRAYKDSFILLRTVNGKFLLNSLNKDSPKGGGYG